MCVCVSPDFPIVLFYSGLMFDFLFVFQREREGVEPDVWGGGEDLGGDKGGEMDQNYCMRKTISNFKKMKNIFITLRSRCTNELDTKYEKLNHSAIAIK